MLFGFVFFGLYRRHLYSDSNLTQSFPLKNIIKYISTTKNTDFCLLRRTGRSEGHQHSFESTPEALRSIGRDGFCRGETTAAAIDLRRVFGLVAFTLLLPVVQIDGTVASNMQSTHSSGKTFPRPVVHISHGHRRSNATAHFMHSNAASLPLPLRRVQREFGPVFYTEFTVTTLLDIPSERRICPFQRILRTLAHDPVVLLHRH